MIGWLLGAAAIYILKPKISFEDPCESEPAEIIDIQCPGDHFLCLGCSRVIRSSLDPGSFTCECGYRYIQRP